MCDLYRKIQRVQEDLANFQGQFSQLNKILARAIVDDEKAKYSGRIQECALKIERASKELSILLKMAKQCPECNAKLNWNDVSPGNKGDSISIEAEISPSSSENQQEYGSSREEKKINSTSSNTRRPIWHILIYLISLAVLFYIIIRVITSLFIDYPFYTALAIIMLSYPITIGFIAAIQQLQGTIKDATYISLVKMTLTAHGRYFKRIFKPSSKSNKDDD